MRRFVDIVFLFLCLSVLSACNRNREEPPFETELPVREIYTPENVWVEINDAEEYDRLVGWSGRLFVVNSPDEFPEGDGIGFSRAYTEADFSNHTILVYYHIHAWEFDRFSYRYVYYNQEAKYNWSILIGVDSPEPTYADRRCLTRFAVMVDKVPEDARVTAGFGLNGNDWD